ncbi:MAG: hypothetical protein HY075_15925 [Deltaproteobacteria bacterium]|nr:hypothetical protein [Deltaproteobacteria bacterium]
MRKETPQTGLEYIYNDGELYSIILRDEYAGTSINFFTPDSFSQQLGYLPHKAGNIIKPHLHKLSRREVEYTHEVLFIKRGKVLVNFYDKQKAHLGSETLGRGDVILLCGGGHGFKVLEECVMIEVKQGPFMGLEDKERFDGVEK